MKSMTGYGTAAVRNNSMALEISVKAVNGRFLETKFHMPPQYAVLEAELRQLIQSKVQRGTVNLYINRRLGDDTANYQTSVQTGLAKQWVRAAKKLAKDTNIDPAIDLEMVLRQPDVIRIEPKKDINQAEKALVKSCMNKALTKFNAERAREGKSIAKDLNAHLKSLETYIQKAMTLRNQANNELSARMKKRLNNLGLDVDIEDNRFAQEVALAIDKADISEEIQRLKEHIKAFRAEIKAAKNSIGKKLDFYAQELLREANTVGSKSPLTKLTQAVVEAKTIIEKIKEQVQNVE
jgi:uncharacterized protein (TIGR00255 family)